MNRLEILTDWFEDWFAGDAGKDERERMLETNKDGLYKLMAAYSAKDAFSAGVSAYQNDMLGKYEKALIAKSCDIAAFETVLLKYFSNKELITIKQGILFNNGIDLDA